MSVLTVNRNPVKQASTASSPEVVSTVVIRRPDAPVAPPLRAGASSLLHPVAIAGERRSCEYIEGDPKQGAPACGEPIKHGSAYCPDHHALCWLTPAEAARRTARWKAAIAGGKKPETETKQAPPKPVPAGLITLAQAAGEIGIASSSLSRYVKQHALAEAHASGNVLVSLERIKAHRSKSSYTKTIAGEEN